MKEVYQGVVDCTPTKYVYTTKEKALAAAKRLFNVERKKGFYNWFQTFEEALEPDEQGFALVYIERLPVRD